MKTLILNHKQVVLILVTVLLLTLGASAISYGQVCNVGDILSPGESCIDGGTGDTFSVLANGRGNYLFITSGAGITVQGNVNGKNRNFVATNRGDGTWLIESVTPGNTPPPAQQPDLVVEQPTVSESTVAPGQTFMLSATVKNEGAGSAAATTLRYYRSTNTTISTSDTEVGTDSVNALGSNRSSAESISLTAPTSPGTYYYGACVAAVANESVSDNNCSAAVKIIVQQSAAQGPDLVIESVEAQPATVDPGERFRLYGTLRNNGTEASAATTVRYYRSTDNIISTTDTQLGTGRRNALAANASIRRFLNVTAPTTPGTYYYGVCVDSVPNESDTANNCTAVSITVRGAPVVSTPSHPFIYWTDAGTEKIQRANLDGSNVQDLVTTGLENPVGIALDVAGGKMYWTDSGTDKIQRANLDGSNIEALVTTGLEIPIGIALDVAGGKMYWTDAGTEKIQRANLDGSNVEALVTTGLEQPEGIALDVVDGKMYWTDWNTDKIQRANLDGSNVEDLVTGRAPTGIALDVAGGKMYWTDFAENKIQRANLDGSNVQDLVTTGLENPIGIALDVAGGKMYWTDRGEIGQNAQWGKEKIQRANLDGSNVEDLVTHFQDGLRLLTHIAVGISSQPLSPIAREDVNGDGVVDVQDIVYVAQRYGRTGESRADVNKDGVVNIDDLIVVAAVVDSTPAAPAARSRIPKDLTAGTVDQWLTEAKLTGKKTPTYQRGILTLEELLAVLTPKETTLLANYPNPFNPETWIPYHLATDSDVLLSIYDINGALVRELDLGHQRAGYYTDRTRAAYWDGRNKFGEQVASGVYFYQLRAGDYLQMRKMVILK